MKHYSTAYELEKDGVVLKFSSEKDACEYLGVAKCTVASCYRRKSLCNCLIEDIDDLVEEMVGDTE